MLEPHEALSKKRLGYKEHESTGVLTPESLPSLVDEDAISGDELIDMMSDTMSAPGEDGTLRHKSDESVLEITTSSPTSLQDCKARAEAVASRRAKVVEQRQKREAEAAQHGSATDQKGFRYDRIRGIPLGYEKGEMSDKLKYWGAPAREAMERMNLSEEDGKKVSGGRQEKTNISAAEDRGTVDARGAEMTVHSLSLFLLARLLSRRDVDAYVVEWRKRMAFEKYQGSHLEKCVTRYIINILRSRIRRWHDQKEATPKSDREKHRVGQTDTVDAAAAEDMFDATVDVDAVEPEETGDKNTSLPLLASFQDLYIMAEVGISAVERISAVEPKETGDGNISDSRLCPFAATFTPEAREGCTKRLRQEVSKLTGIPFSTGYFQYLEHMVAAIRLMGRNVVVVVETENICPITGGVVTWFPH